MWLKSQIFIQKSLPLKVIVNFDFCLDTRLSIVWIVDIIAKMYAICHASDREISTLSFWQVMCPCASTYTYSSDSGKRSESDNGRHNAIEWKSKFQKSTIYNGNEEYWRDYRVAQQSHHVNTPYSRNNYYTKCKKKTKIWMRFFL